MRSPRDPRATLQGTTLEDGLRGFRCPTTNGIWIDGSAYWAWIRARQGRPADASSSRADVPLAPSGEDHAVISPRSGRIMRKFRVCASVPFSIDYDAASGGFWLDAGEYNALSALGLGAALHLICSEEYQRELGRQEAEDTRQARLTKLLGADDAARLREIADWVATLDHPEAAIAYLLERQG